MIEPSTGRKVIVLSVAKGPQTNDTIKWRIKACDLANDLRINLDTLVDPIPDLTTAAAQRWAASEIVNSTDSWPDIQHAPDHWLCRCFVGTGTPADQEQLAEALNRLVWW